jgi:hypothetical protein
VYRISGSKITKTAPNFNEKNGTVAITIIKIIILRRIKKFRTYSHSIVAGVILYSLHFY